MTAGTNEPADRCGECGMMVEGGSTGCHRLFEELLARDFSNPLYFRSHRMMVDAYCLQHPERYCRSSKSLAAHLVSLCSMIEAGEDRAVGAESIREWLDGRSPVEKPDLPESRGELTVDSLTGSETPEQHSAAVERWARSTWDAYAPLHDLARQWLEQTELLPTR